MCRVASAVLNAKLTEVPYSAVYLYDGIRPRNPINASEIENGLAPAISDAIVSYIDGLSGDAFCRALGQLQVLL